MKRSLYLLISLLVLAATVLSACGTPATPVATEAAATQPPAASKNPLLIAINKSADQQYFIDLQNSFVAAATGLGATAKKFDAKLDPNLGVNLVNDAISAGAKGISITVPDQTIGPAIAKAAKDAGVVLIATDDSIKDADGKPVPFVGFDGKDMGKKVGEAAAKLLTDSGWLKDSAKKVGVLSVEVATLSVCVDRTDNEKAAIKAAGVTDAQIFPVPYTGETLSSQDAAGPVITAHPDITNWVVMSCNDEGVLGTLNALATAGVKTDNIIAVGLGAYEACKPWAAGQPSGFKAALFISGLDVGKTAATVLYDAVVNGKTPPEKSYAPTNIVDAANFKTTMDSISVGNCSAGAKPPVAASKPLLIAINKSADQQYFIDLQNSFVATAGKLGADAKKFDAKLDPNLGVNLVNDAISAGAKGISITVPDQTIGPAIAKAAKDAGVILIATDDSIKDADGKPVPFVGFDGKDMGKKVGEAAGKLLTESGWLKDSAKKVGVLSVEVATLSVCVDRTDNEKAALKAAGVTDAQIFPVPYTGETLSSQDAAGPVITAHPDITNWIVTSCNDEGVLGTLNALATAGVKTDNIIAVGLGAYEACKPWAAGQPTGFKAALFISGLDVGTTAATVLYDAVVNGKTPPAVTYAPTSIVDATNFKTTMDSISVGNCSK